MGSPFHLINFPKRALLGIVFFCSFLIASLFGDKVTQSVIVASIEGEVSSLNLIDDFKVNMSSSYVGKKISPKTILTTGKTGKVSLLFSNGTLITIKPGSRFYLRKYKQLEAVVEDLAPPGKLEEEPTKSELSAHLDFGDLIVKAPKLKKGSSMNLSSPIGTAGIRGTMFQFMAVRNPVTGDIMGGINLVSGDIEFTDTDGNTVTILSGQSIQLATSKLGESVASQTGELVDLSSTYGPALTEAGALPPPISSIFPNLNLSGDSDEDDSGEEGSFDEPMVVGPSAGDLDFIHEIASEVFFAIGESEQVSSDFTFESIQMAPPVEAPLPEVEAPSAPASVTGETVAGGNIDRFLGLPPELSLRDQAAAGTPNADPLFQVLSGGSRIVAEFRSPDEGLTWADLDPGVSAFDFLDNDIESAVILSNVPDIVLDNPADAPGVGESVVYNVVYQVTDFRNSSTSISKEVEVVATRPTIQPLPTLPDIPFTDPNDVFMDWINQIQVFDVRGQQLSYSASAKDDSFYLSLDPTSYISTNNSNTDFQIIAKDWRGLTTVSSTQTLSIRAQLPEVTGENLYVELSDQPLSSIPHNISGVDEFGNEINSSSITLLNARDSSGSVFGPDTLIYSLPKQIYTLTYLVEDTRDIATEVTRTLTISANAPSFEDDGKPFESNATWLTGSSSPTLEYTDPLDEFGNWINSQKVTDFAGSEVVITPEIVSYSNGAIPEFVAPYKTLPSGSYEIKFTAIDSRFIENVTHPDWEADLTSIYNTSFTIISTPPTLEITNGGWRDGLIFDPTGENTGDKFIEYLVKPQPQYLKFDPSSDDGIFSILPKPEGGGESRKVYIKATAFDGTDISASIQIENNKTSNKLYITSESTFGVDYDVDPVNTLTNLTVSIDDSSHREIQGGGQIVEANFNVKLVDKLGPFLKIPDGLEPFSIEGTRGQAFPVPRIEIIDNYYSQNDIETPGVSVTPNYYLDFNHTQYPDSVSDWLVDTNENPDLSVDGILAFSGFYSDYLTYSAISDPSGNQARNSIQLDINITDSVSPTVQLISGTPYYVDLSQTTNYPNNNLGGSAGGSLFADPGVQISENLFVHEFGESSIQLSDGRVIGALLGSLANANDRFTVIVQAYAEDNVTLSEDLNNSIESILENYDYNTDPYKYKVTYSFTDRAGNSATASRDFEFTNDPNAPSIINFYRADGNSTNIYETEVDVSNGNEIIPDVFGYFSVSSGNVNVSISSQTYYQQSIDNNTTNGILGNSINYFYNDLTDVEYFIDSSGNLIAKDTDGYPKHIVRYTAQNQFGDEYVYDLEIRVKDIEGPTFNFSQATTITLEGGYPYTDDFDDINSSLQDNYFSVSRLNLIRTITKGGISYTDPSGDDPFDDFSNIGFWDVGTYTVTYTASDDLNNTTTKTRTIIVQDTIAPHIALVPSTYTNGQNLTASSDLVSVNPLLFTPEDLIGSVYGSYTSLVFSSTDPFVNLPSSTDVVLKYSEANSSLFSSSEVNLEINDTTEVFDDDVTGRQNESSHEERNVDSGNYGRTKLWYSAFALKENGTVYFRDPGVYVENNTSETVEIYSKIHNLSLSDNGELVSFSVSYYSGDNSIELAREYSFVDEISPLITLTPDTTENLLIELEAGVQLTDLDDTTPPDLWDYDLNASAPAQFSPLSTTSYDARDGVLTGSIQRTLYLVGSQNGISLPLSTNNSHLNSRFKVFYSVSDSEGNEANASRYYIVRDTTPPTITNTTSDEVVIDYLSSDASSLANAQTRMLQNLSADDNGSGVEIDANLDTVVDRAKWVVNITKPDGSSFVPGSVFPSADGGSGYNVLITVTDESNNISSNYDRTLIVRDNTAPSFTMVGPSIIHDFFRYGSRLPTIGTEDLHQDRPGSPDFNGSGFGSGAHRLMLADYSFVDPGIYAEDASFSLDEYPDFDGDGIGEAHAMIFVDPDQNWPDPLTTGIIYCKSTFNTTTIAEIQNQFATSNNSLLEVNSSVRLDDNSVLSAEITQRIINYRVKDGWGNVNDINRTIYIYESSWASVGKAFYATPLSKYSSDSNFSDLDDLSVAETDYDGDGVSDFWEIALGTRFDDASDIPAFDFSSPAAFSGVNISNLKANIDSIKSNPQYSALLGVDNYLEFNGTVPTP